MTEQIPLTGIEDSFEHHGVLLQKWGVINRFVGKYYVPGVPTKIVDVIKNSGLPSAAGKRLESALKREGGNTGNRHRLTKKDIENRKREYYRRMEDALNQAKQRMNTKQDVSSKAVTDKGMAQYPEQKLEDLGRRSSPMSSKIRYEINHPPDEDSKGRHFNCPNCASAFDMAYRGYDVIARPAKNGSNVGDIEKNYIGGKLVQGSKVGSVIVSKLNDLDSIATDKYNSYKKYRGNDPAKKEALRKEKEDAEFNYNTELTKAQYKAADDTVDAIASQPKNARGIVVVGWLADTDLSKRTTEYHALNYINNKDGVKFYDAQRKNPKYYDGMSAKAAKEDFFLDIDPREVYIMRTDNLQPSPQITQAVYSPSGRR